MPLVQLLHLWNECTLYCTIHSYCFISAQIGTWNERNRICYNQIANMPCISFWSYCKLHHIISCAVIALIHAHRTVSSSCNCKKLFQTICYHFLDIQSRMTTMQINISKISKAWVANLLLNILFVHRAFF